MKTGLFIKNEHHVNNLLALIPETCEIVHLYAVLPDSVVALAEARPTLKILYSFWLGNKPDEYIGIREGEPYQMRGYADGQKNGNSPGWKPLTDEQWYSDTINKRFDPQLAVHLWLNHPNIKNNMQSFHNAPMSIKNRIYFDAYEDGDFVDLMRFEVARVQELAKLGFGAVVWNNDSSKTPRFEDWKEQHLLSTLSEKNGMIGYRQRSLDTLAAPRYSERLQDVGYASIPLVASWFGQPVTGGYVQSVVRAVEELATLPEQHHYACIYGAAVDEPAYEVKSLAGELLAALGNVEPTPDPEPSDGSLPDSITISYLTPEGTISKHYMSGTGEGDAAVWKAKYEAAQAKLEAILDILRPT